MVGAPRAHAATGARRRRPPGRCRSLDRPRAAEVRSRLHAAVPHAEERPGRGRRLRRALRPTVAVQESRGRRRRPAPRSRDGHGDRVCPAGPATKASKPPAVSRSRASPASSSIRGPAMVRPRADRMDAGPVMTPSPERSLRAEVDSLPARRATSSCTGMFGRRGGPRLDRGVRASLGQPARRPRNPRVQWRELARRRRDRGSPRSDPRHFSALRGPGRGPEARRGRRRVCSTARRFPSRPRSS